MTDTAIATARRMGANDALVARRYRAERRFKFYGIAAIAVTAIFLVLLFVDILGKGLPAFFESRITLPVKIDQSAIDPQNTKDPAVIRTGDFDTPIREAFRALFPNVTARSDRKQLLGLLSSGAADDFRAMVMSDPSLIGGDAKIPVLLSDDADQYLKGRQTGVERYPGQGTMTAMAEGEQFRLATSSIALLAPGDIVRLNGGAFRVLAADNGALLAEQLTAPQSLAPADPGAWDILRFTVPETNRRIDDREALWLEALKDKGLA
jgi:phosphate transport system permease protein